jgi:hypothetical protein
MKRRRPFGVMVIAILQGLGALGTLSVVDDVIMFANRLGVDLLDAADGLWLLPIPLVGFAISIGLWFLKRWAWLATMLWVGVGMAFGLYAYVIGEPQYLTMLINIATVFYLNQREVQAAFRSRPATTPAPAAPIPPPAVPGGAA